MDLQLQATSTKVIRPPRIVVYGPPGVGKSTFASDAPNTIFLDIEDGLDAIDSVCVKAKTGAEVTDALEAILTQEHGYQTLALDSADWLQTLLGKEVAAEHNQPTVSDVPYGAGYAGLATNFQCVLDLLTRIRNERNMAIIVICHSAVKTFNDPTTEAYDHYTMKLHDSKNVSISGILTEWSDILMFANQKVFAEKTDEKFGKKVYKGRGGERVIHTVGSPAFEAKNRYGLPPELPLSWDAFIQAYINTQQGEKTNG